MSILNNKFTLWVKTKLFTKLSVSITITGRAPCIIVTNLNMIAGQVAIR